MGPAVSKRILGASPPVVIRGATDPSGRPPPRIRRRAPPIARWVAVRPGRVPAVAPADRTSDTSEHFGRTQLEMGTTAEIASRWTVSPAEADPGHPTHIRAGGAVDRRVAGSNPARGACESPAQAEFFFAPDRVAMRSRAAVARPYLGPAGLTVLATAVHAWPLPPCRYPQDDETPEPVQAPAAGDPRVAA